MNKGTIDVEKIMKEIREEIKEKGFTPDMLLFRDTRFPGVEGFSFQTKEFNSLINSLNQSKTVPWIINDTSSGLKRIIKKVVRKLVNFTIEPFAKGQNAYNQQIADAFTQTLVAIEEQNRLIKDYEQIIESLQKKLEKMEK